MDITLKVWLNIIVYCHYTLNDLILETSARDNKMTKAKVDQ